MERQVDVVKTGTWLYDDHTEMSVRIIRQNWDYYHEDGYDDASPNLSSEGQAFYVVYGEALPPELGSEYQHASYPSRSRTCLSLQEALDLAEQILPARITWANTSDIDRFDE